MLDGDTKSAHVIPKALGGRLTSRRTECSECNEYFGHLEQELAASLRPLSAGFGAFTGDRREIVHRREIPGEGPVDARAGLLVRPLPPPEVVRVDDKILRYRKLPRSDKARAKVLARDLFDDGKTVEDFDAGQFEFEFEPWTNKTRTVEVPDECIRVGRRSHERAFTKTAISFLGTCHEEAARSAFLQDAARFARLDRGRIRFRPDPSSPGCGLLPDALPRYHHCVEVWTYAAQLHARIVFFGRISFSATLGRWPRPPVSCAYVLDPTLQASAKKYFEPSEGLPPGLLHEESAEELVASVEDFIESESKVFAASAKDDPTTKAPDMGVLRPMIRNELTNLWSRAKPKRDRGGRKRRRLKKE